jgi:multidrug efflux pump subunit AcrA (membrane-fusion protein)
MVPNNAIISKETRRVVFVVRSERAVETPVDAGASSNGSTEVRGGIAPGDRVIVDAPGELSDGARVAVRAVSR